MRFQFFLLTAIAGSTLLTSCGPTLEEGHDARIRVTPPQQVTFSRVTIGQSHALPFVISSVGHDPLTVRKIEWKGSDAVVLSATSTLPRELATQATMPVTVTFAPSTQSPSPDGTIQIYTNDIETPVYTLDVIAQQLSPLIHVVPSAEEKLIFGQIDVGSTSTQKITITNVGDLPLEVESLQLVASSDFSLKHSASFPTTIAQNTTDTLVVQVAFSPSAIGKQEATLVIASNDPTHPKYELPIVANSDSPCLRIQPSLLEFTPSVSIGTSRTQSVALTSCSDVPLTISEVIQTAGEKVFSYTLKDADTDLKNGESATLEVTFSPTSEGTSQGAFTIINSDPLQPNATLSVMGYSSSNQCPKAVAQARLSSSSTWATSLDLAPLDTVIFDGSQSSDAESTQLQYFWSIESAPKDSTARIASDGNSASYFLDLAGSYKICLNVEDSEGMMSCNASCIPITATPRETIHVQLVWHTPADTTIGDDDGTDLDLHLLSYPDGTWGDTGTAELNNGTDVYYKNQSPVWTVAGYGNEYPSLDIDDKDGEGPENINLDNPAPCRWYAIGVHYFADNAFGASYATLRAYIAGKPLFEKANISLSQQGTFKHVAWLFWTGQQAYFFETDLAYEGESWLGLAPVPSSEILDKARQYAPTCFE